VTFLLSALGWLTGSKVGRWVGIAALAVVAGLIAWRAAVASGERKAALEQAQASLSNLRERVSSDDAISRLPADVRRGRLREWSQSSQR